MTASRRSDGDDDRPCGTCGGERVLIGDATDRHGERTDDEVPCPDCSDDRDYRELDEPEDLTPLERWWPATSPPADRSALDE